MTRGGAAGSADLDSSQCVSVVLTGHQGHLLIDPGFLLFHVGHKLLVLQGLLQPLAPVRSREKSAVLPTLTLTADVLTETDKCGT